MLNRFLNFIKQQHLFDFSQEVLLAVSGGRDSVALCDLAVRAGLKFSIAHCNFHLRPFDCDRDMVFVARLAESLHVPFYVREFDTKEHASSSGLSIEEAARIERYSFFAEICRLHGIDYVATAHHQDDSIETFFINLLRGTGIAGLHGIQAISGNVVRPMLCFSRNDIDVYVKERGLEYVEDYTNSQIEFRRNAIRHKLIPVAKEISPSFNSTMIENMARLSEVESIYRQAIESFVSQSLHRHIDSSGVVDRWSVLLSDIKGWKAPRTILFELLRQFHFSIGVVDDILSDLQRPPGSKFYSRDYMIVQERDSLDILPLRKSDESAPIFLQKNVLSKKEWILVPPFHLHIYVLDSGELERPIRLPQTSAAFDFDSLGDILHLRHWKNGDRFHPMGMRGSRLVSDFFKDNKMSNYEKENTWLLCDEDDRIVWIVGMRADENYKVSDTTTRVLMMNITID